jgi:hypothetical protein
LLSLCCSCSGPLSAPGTGGRADDAAQAVGATEVG